MTARRIDEKKGKEKRTDPVREKEATSTEQALKGVTETEEECRRETGRAMATI
jgi:hypothetical protein